MDAIVEILSAETRAPGLLTIFLEKLFRTTV